MPPWKYTGLLTRILLPEAMFRADTGEMSIFLTYDDGPDPEVTPALLDILAERDAKAVFFVIFNKANWWKDLIREISQQGHRIAFHGMRHRHPPRYCSLSEKERNPDRAMDEYSRRLQQNE